ncbi:MAG: hypothetical protein LBG08_03490, partial [Spirochaetaceae bacterium]|nr:hypothetical protein [Spirochaetaceae bacterium]
MNQSQDFSFGKAQRQGVFLKKGFGGYFFLTFLIGFGFFTMGLMDPLYDTYVPLFLRRYIGSNA